MPSTQVRHFNWNDLPLEKVGPLLDRKLITGDGMMLAHVYLKKGCIVPRHQHHNEQLTYILEGALRFWIGEDEGEVIDVRAGEVLHLPSLVWHKAEALRTRWTWTCSTHLARTGSTRRTTTCAGRSSRRGRQPLERRRCRACRQAPNSATAPPAATSASPQCVWPA